MANPKLFSTRSSKTVPATDAVNHEWAPAYRYGRKHLLAQVAATGCLNATFYAGAREQLDVVLDLARDLEPEFIAKTAIHSREKGHLKDMPALLTAILATRAPELLEVVFKQVIDNQKMLRNFVQIMRSGVTGRRSLGSRPKRLVREWLANRSDEAVFKDSIGGNPSLRDILKMVHPKPASRRREALFGYILGGEHDREALPGLVRRYEAYKAGEELEVPEVPFQMLTSLPLGKAEWTDIALRATWQQTRMNLNSFLRHGVLEDGSEVTRRIAAKLGDERAVRKARAFPYQLLVAHRYLDLGVPQVIREALETALEAATQNVPALPGRVVVCPDVSGSMAWPVTGYRKGGTSLVCCVDVAALVTATVLRRNPKARVMPFDTHLHNARRLDPRRSILVNADRLSRFGGGGTNCSLPLAELNRKRTRADLVLYVSDNQSWVDADHEAGTAMMKQWRKFKHHNAGARLVCLDIQPYGTTQAAENEDVLNIGGFNDQVFQVIADFATGRLSDGHWVEQIERIVL